MKTFLTLAISAALVAAALSKDMPPILPQYHATGVGLSDKADYEFGANGDQYYVIIENSKDESFTQGWTDMDALTNIIYLESPTIDPMCMDFGEPDQPPGFFPYNGEPFLTEEGIECGDGLTCDCYGEYKDEDEEILIFTCIDAAITDYAHPVYLGGKLGTLRARVIDTTSFEKGTGPEEKWKVCELDDF